MLPLCTGMAVLFAAGVLSSGSALAAEHDVLRLFPDADPPEWIVAIDPARLSPEERLLVASLQGLAVDTPVGIYVVEGATYRHWLRLIEHEGIRVESVRTMDELIETIRGVVPVAGYVRTRTGHPSVNAATSLASLMRGTVLDIRLVDRARVWGWEELADATALGDRDAWELGKDSFSRDLLFQQAPDKWHLRDAVIGSRAFILYDPDAALYREVASHVKPNAPVLGWGRGGEDRHVGDATSHGLRTIPADWSLNLSVLARFSLDRLEQKRSVPEEPEWEPDVHYVTFVMSDGDNIQWLLGNNFAHSPRYFGSRSRGSFPMGWQFSPGLIDVAPLAMRWFYEGAEEDEFVMGVSGTGYFLPSRYPEDALSRQALQLESAISRTDMPIVTILDHADLRSELFGRVAEAYATAPSLMGVIYLNYADYAAGRGDAIWVGETPFISARFKLWDSFPRSVAARINALPKRPESMDGYTIVSVHPWSHTLDDVRTVVDDLEEHVRVVLPSELFRRVITHVER